jgi:hypothetical protein
VANQLIALAVPLIIALTYRPPAWLSARLEVTHAT